MNPYWMLPGIVTGWIAVSSLCLWWISRQRVDPTTMRGPVSVLKPLCGLDPSLERNLETFFVQDHQDFELVFGVEGTDDVAAEVVRRVQARFPHVRSKLVVHQGGPGLNPKVRNLQAMMPHAAFDVVLISDSNVAVPPTYVREMVDALAEDANVGLVTSLFRSGEPRSVGAIMESLEFAGHMAGALAVPNVTSNAGFVVGKSMMFRRSTFEALGGWSSVAFVLAEDLVIGQMYSRAGLRIRIVPTPIDNVNPNQSVSAMVDRHRRWSVIRRLATPAVWMLEPFVKPLFVAALAPLFGVGLDAALLWAVPTILVRDASGWLLLHDWRHLLRVLPLSLVRDFVQLWIWASSSVCWRVNWRGTWLDVTWGCRLYRTKIHTPLRSVAARNPS